MNADTGIPDVVIAGGTVVDGTGAPAYQADIAIARGRILRVAAERIAGRRVIDATGLIVAPGLIDLHSHADFTILDSPAAITQLAQGVTTVVGGNCGQSTFPVTERNRGAVGLNGEKRLDATWSDLAGFARQVQERRPAVNVGMMIGHNTLRSAVMGDDHRRPTDDELVEMCAHIGRAAAQGALGFSSGLVYAPGCFAGHEELRILVAAAARAGLTYCTHVRNETDHLLEAVAEAIGLARDAGARLHVSHLKGMGPHGKGLSRIALDMLAAARADGVDAMCDVYPYTASSTALSSRLPDWALAGGTGPRDARLRDDSTRARIVADLDERFRRDIDPTAIVLATHARRLVDFAEQWGVTPAEAIIRILRESGDGIIINHAIDESDMLHVLSDPHTVVASDGWILAEHGEGTPHPRSFGTFARTLSAPMLGHSGLTIEEAVRKCTSLPASRFGLVDRGILQEGAAADVTIFDRNTIADRSTFQNPWQLAEGTRTVIVNGQISWQDGKPTRARAGCVL